MSRSYRKPWITDGYKGSNCRQFYKRCANRKIRRSKDVPNGRAFKKFYETWDICDYKSLADEKAEWFKKNFWHYNRK